MPRGGGGLALLTQEWQSISRSDLESASNEESSGIMRQACQDVFICLRPSESSASLPGSTDGFQERAHHGKCVFRSIYVLLNLFLSSAWDWTLAEKWLADKKEEEKVSFQCVRSGNPLPPQVLFRLGKTQGNYSVCLARFVASECWSCLSLFLKCMSAVNALLKDNHCRGCT